MGYVRRRGTEQQPTELQIILTESEQFSTNDIVFPLRIEIQYDIILFYEILNLIYPVDILVAINIQYYIQQLVGKLEIRNLYELDVLEVDTQDL